MVEVRPQLQSIRNRPEPLGAVARLVARALIRCDDETADHQRRIGAYATALAASVGWDREPPRRLFHAAALHDIGKVGVPAAILRKRGRLEGSEMAAMRLHPEIGARLLGTDWHPFLRLAREIALHHHERWDGLGYPRGLRAAAIPMSARIVAVVDVFDALRCDRVYRPALPDGDVVTFLRQGRGRRFDPQVLDCFLRLFQRDGADGLERSGRRLAGYGLRRLPH